MSDAETEIGVDRQERHRLAIVAASVPLLLLVAPLFLPFYHDRSLLAQSRWEPMLLAVLAFFFGPPLFVAAVGLGRSVARRAPSTAAFAVPMVPYLLALVGMAMAILGDFDRHGARDKPFLWAAVLTCIVGVYVLGRGVRRAGWERWAQLVAGVWALHLVAVMIGAASSGYDAPGLGGWLHTFALSAAAPAIAWILWPKRRS